MGLMDKLKKNSKLEDVDILGESKFFNEKEMVSTIVPMINTALSGQLDGGLAPGLGVMAGPSKHFKTSFALLMAGAYLDKYPDAVMLFYDSEFGSTEAYFKAYNIDTSRVLHIPIKDIEELKFDIVSQFEGITREDKVVVVIDSIGNLASKKELEDAKIEKSVTDMTRAKSLKGLFRMVTPYLAMKDIPLIAINHTYMTQEMFSKAVVSGGTGIYYSANWIFIIGRRQNKTGTEVTGYDFIINIEKSRNVKEKSKIPISVSWEGGVEKYSGLQELAIAGGFIKQSGAWYQVMDFETGEVQEKKLRANQIDEEFYEALLLDENFKELIKKQYMIGYKAELSDNFLEELDEEIKGGV